MGVVHFWRVAVAVACPLLVVLSRFLRRRGIWGASLVICRSCGLLRLAGVISVAVGFGHGVLRVAAQRMHGWFRHPDSLIDMLTCIMTAESAFACRLGANELNVSLFSLLH
jgi:hypothetical protein